MSSDSEQIRRSIERVVRESADFLVDTESGAEVGVVEKVTLGTEDCVARIVVCCGWFGRRRRMFALEDVVAASASRRLLVVSDACVVAAGPEA